MTTEELFDRMQNSQIDDLVTTDNSRRLAPQPKEEPAPPAFINI